MRFILLQHAPVASPLRGLGVPAFRSPVGRMVTASVECSHCGDDMA
jgi:hypothetical protein